MGEIERKIKNLIRLLCDEASYLTDQRNLPAMMKLLAVLLQVGIGFHHFQTQHLLLPLELIQKSTIELFHLELALQEAEYSHQRFIRI